MRTMIRLFLAAFAVTMLFGLAPPAQAQSLKVGVFDPQRVSSECAEARRLQAELMVIRQAKQAEIQVQEQEITTLRQRLEQQALSLSADKRTTMEIDIQRKLLALNTVKELANQELQLEFTAAEARFNEKLRAVVEEFGRNEDFTLILDAAAVAWAAAAIDVTTPIIDQFNKMYPVGSGGEGGATE